MRGKEETVEGACRAANTNGPRDARAEGCGLDEAGFLDAELQPGFAGEFHFGKEHEAALGAVDEEHAPEVDGIAGAQVDGVAPRPRRRGRHRRPCGPSRRGGARPNSWTAIPCRRRCARWRRGRPRDFRDRHDAWSRRMPCSGTRMERSRAGGKAARGEGVEPGGGHAILRDGTKARAMASS